MIDRERDFMTLARFSSMEEAQVVKAMLDSMGVESQIVNDTVADILPMLEGDIKIIVNTAAYQQARDILNARFDTNKFKDAWKDEHLY